MPPADDAMQNDPPSTAPLDQLHGPAFGSAPVLDRDAFRALEELAGDDDPDLITDLVQLYLEDSRTRMNDVESGPGSSEHTRVGSAAHALKSSSANIGALTFSKVCADLEQCARAVDGVDVADLERLCTQAHAMYVEVRNTLALFSTPI